MSSVSIRLAVPTDLPSISFIYNYYVIHSTCTFQTEPETFQDRAAWFASHGPQYPVIVVEEAGEVIGWGSLSPFHPREAYRPTVENSLYVRQDRVGRRIGKMLLDDLIRRGRSIGFHSMIALISSEQEPSLRLHRSAGFLPAGHLTEVGRKFDRWLDVAYLQKTLNEEGAQTL